MEDCFLVPRGPLRVCPTMSLFSTLQPERIGVDKGEPKIKGKRVDFEQEISPAEYSRNGRKAGYDIRPLQIL